MDTVNVEAMDRYRLWRNKDNWVWIKEIELLRQFLSFAVTASGQPRIPRKV